MLLQVWLCAQVETVDLFRFHACHQGYHAPGLPQRTLQCSLAGNIMKWCDKRLHVSYVRHVTDMSCSNLLVTLFIDSLFARWGEIPYRRCISPFRPRVRSLFRQGHESTEVWSQNRMTQWTTVNQNGSNNVKHDQSACLALNIAQLKGKMLFDLVWRVWLIMIM